MAGQIILFGWSDNFSNRWPFIINNGGQIALANPPGNINTIAQYSLCMAMHKKKDMVDMETLQEALLHYAEPL